LGVTQSIGYNSSAGTGGLGQPSGVSETDNGVTYSCSYLYNTAGDRCQSIYTTPNGTVKWGYGDYQSYGTPEKPSRVFQTLNKLDANGNPTSEEFHYEYDSMGRLTNAAFMQTPQTGQTGYSSSYPAAPDTFQTCGLEPPARPLGHAGSQSKSDSPQASPSLDPPLGRGDGARVYYNYDVSGVMTNIEHYWDTWDGTKYTSVPILVAVCSYDPYKLLKTRARPLLRGARERSERGVC
jgi:hypothetical protein